MSEIKKCWQIDYLPQPTHCFKKAGNTPCETPGCSVDDRIQELEEKEIEVTSDWISLLSHSKCRLSSLAENNEEYLKKIKSK